MAKDVVLPKDLQKALGTSTRARSAWQSLTPLARRDFISWIAEPARAETHARRVKVAISKLEKGQRRPCCYAVVPMELYWALGENAKAKAAWKVLSPDARRDFNDWIHAAKDKDTRGVRVAKATGMIAAGKKRP